MGSLVIDGHPPLRVVSIEGKEALSSLFAFDLILDPGDAPAPEGAIGEIATLRFSQGERTRTISGILRTFEQGDADRGPSRCRATLAPAAYVLALREDCRIFQGRRAPEVIQAVLEAAGLTGQDYRLVLAGDYAVREHTVQYRESDWNFLLRLMESEGIHSFFEHADDRVVLVFADAPGAHPRMSEPDALRFRPAGGALFDGERVERFRHVQELRAGKIALKGHSFRTPRAVLETRATRDDGAPAIFDAPPEFDAPEAGDRLARLRLEQEVASGGVGHASSDCLGLQPGVVFGLREHGVDSLNRAWLVTSIEHHFNAAGEGQEEATYRNAFTCIPSDVPFRARTRTPKPVVGIQTAVVVGPAGQDIHCDELGRVKVQFAWDRAGKGDDQSSSWIRVSQAWAGPGYGTLFIPRVGHEVLVDFAGGDPDRPIVVGSVYNGANLPPLSLPEDKTATILRSATSPGNEGQSELRMEARRGGENVQLVSFRDLGIRVGHDKDESVSHDERLRVGGDRARAVEGGESVMIGKDRGLDVGGSHARSVGGDDSVEVGGDQEVNVGGDRAISVTGQSTEIVGEHLVVRVGGNRTETVIGSGRESVLGARAVVARSYALEVNEKMETRVAGDQDERVGGAKRTSAGEIVELICGDATITAHKDGTVTLVGKEVRVKVSGPVEVEGGRLSIKAQGSVNLSAGGTVKVRGRGVNLN
jgi:type VI secretion system secreted protein VgrG